MSRKSNLIANFYSAFKKGNNEEARHFLREYIMIEVKKYERILKQQYAEGYLDFQI